MKDTGTNEWDSFCLLFYKEWPFARWSHETAYKKIFLPLSVLPWEMIVRAAWV